VSEQVRGGQEGEGMKGGVRRGGGEEDSVEVGSKVVCGK